MVGGRGPLTTLIMSQRLPKWIDTLFRSILTSRVYEVAHETPLDRADKLSARFGNEMLLKREDLQPVFSFKLRGAYNKIAHLSPAEAERGVIAASAGNHAQGVAYSAKHLGLQAVIVMPRTTPAIKVEAVRSLGAQVVLTGDSYTDAEVECAEIQKKKGLTLVHSFNDPLVVAGQGTIGNEILRYGHRELEAVFVPIGGGGLIAGIGTVIKSLMPSIRVIGVEPFESDAMYRSLEAGRRIRLDHVGIFVDGVAVRQVGDVTFPIVRHVVDEVLRVTNDEICAAIKDVFDDTRTVIEPAGALAVAGMKQFVKREHLEGRKLAAVTSGANMNFDRLRFVAERAELGQAREAIFSVTIPERAGAFREFCHAIGRRVVTEFNYRLSARSEAHIFVGVSVQSREDAKELGTKLGKLGYQTLDLSDNEMAKLHVRHMVGGRAREVRHEWPCRFEFPERPGALMEFLDKLGERWNISLFHYRNHGSDFGRVLVGFEVPPKDRLELESFLERLGYAYTPESSNESYRLFLT
jgi:threonine dehydratase